MKSFTYTVTDALGIHARPAGQLVKEAGQYACAVTLAKGDKEADAKKVFRVMGLAVKSGDAITVTCEGEDEDAAAAALEKLVREIL